MLKIMRAQRISHAVDYRAPRWRLGKGVPCQAHRRITAPERRDSVVFEHQRWWGSGSVRLFSCSAARVARYRTMKKTSATSFIDLAPADWALPTAIMGVAA
jgi:hypothetical protein